MKAVLYFVILFVSSKSLQVLNTKLISIKECKKPRPPIMDNLLQKGYFKIESYKANDKILIKGNVTLFQDTTILLQMGFKNLNFKGLTCKHVMVKVLFQLTKLKYNTNTCIISRGSYYFDGLDSEVVDKRASFMPARRPGVVNGVIAIYGKEGTYACYDMRFNVTK